MPGMLSADGPLALCDLAQADIQQIEAGETRRMTVFISGQSHPDPLFTDQPEGWQVSRRRIFSPGDGRGGITLRFPEALESTLDPGTFPSAAQTPAQTFTYAFQPGAMRG